MKGHTLGAQVLHTFILLSLLGVFTHCSRDPKEVPSKTEGADQAPTGSTPEEGAGGVDGEAGSSGSTEEASEAVRDYRPEIFVMGLPERLPGKISFGFNWPVVDKIGAAVSIRHRSSGAGELKIKYGSLEELQGVLNQLGVGDE